MDDDARQNALATVVELAALQHALRALTREVEGLLAESMRHANEGGLAQVTIAKAADVSAGRVSQIIGSGPSSLTQGPLQERSRHILEWPGDELRSLKADFGGRMTFPPY